MVYIAAAELVVILALVVLNHRARNEEPKTLARFALMLEEQGFKERVELLNAARNPGHVLRTEQPEAPERDPEEEERMRVYTRNWDAVGRVVDYEAPE
jgi:hypothetical protein